MSLPEASPSSSSSFRSRSSKPLHLHGAPAPPSPEPHLPGARAPDLPDWEGAAGGAPAAVWRPPLPCAPPTAPKAARRGPTSPPPPSRSRTTPKTAPRQHTTGRRCRRRRRRRRRDPRRRPRRPRNGTPRAGAVVVAIPRRPPRRPRDGLRRAQGQPQRRGPKGGPTPPQGPGGGRRAGGPVGRRGARAPARPAARPAPPAGILERAPWGHPRPVERGPGASWRSPGSAPSAAKGRASPGQPAGLRRAFFAARSRCRPARGLQGVAYFPHRAEQRGREEITPQGAPTPPPPPLPSPCSSGQAVLA